MRTRFTPVLLFAAPVLALMLVAACGNADEDRVGVKEFGPGVTLTPRNYTPVSSATPAGTGATSASPVAAATGAAAASFTGRDVTIEARDNEFVQKEFQIQNQEAVRLTLQNKGSAVHNWHLIGVKDAAGNEPTTPLIPGGQETKITFTIAQPGAYTYRCDVHPEMTGRVTVR